MSLQTDTSSGLVSDCLSWVSPEIVCDEGMKVFAAYKEALGTTSKRGGGMSPDRQKTESHQSPAENGKERSASLSDRSSPYTTSSFLLQRWREPFGGRKESLSACLRKESGTRTDEVGREKEENWERQPRTPQSAGGATRAVVLLCVMSGSLGEGVNFSDNLARLLILVGLPYPNIKDREFQLRSSYFSRLVLEKERRGAREETNGGLGSYDSVDKEKENQATSCSEESKKISGETEEKWTGSGSQDERSGSLIRKTSRSRGTEAETSQAKAASLPKERKENEAFSAPHEKGLSNSLRSTPGSRSYSNRTMPVSAPSPSYGFLQCIQTVNQTIGRSIRHKEDYASVLLIDKRYKESSVQTHLSKWIQDSLRYHYGQSQYDGKSKCTYTSKAPQGTGESRREHFTNFSSSEMNNSCLSPPRSHEENDNEVGDVVARRLERFFQQMSLQRQSSCGRRD